MTQCLETEEDKRLFPLLRNRIAKLARVYDNIAKNPVTTTEMKDSLIEPLPHQEYQVTRPRNCSRSTMRNYSPRSCSPKPRPSGPRASTNAPRGGQNSGNRGGRQQGAPSPRTGTITTDQDRDMAILDAPNSWPPTAPTSLPSSSRHQSWPDYDPSSTEMAYIDNINKLDIPSTPADGSNNSSIGELNSTGIPATPTVDDISSSQVGDHNSTSVSSGNEQVPRNLYCLLLMIKVLLTCPTSSFQTSKGSFWSKVFPSAPHQVSAASAMPKLL